MARAIRNKGLSSLCDFCLTSSHKSTQQRNIKGDYVALTHRMASFSTEEHNEHW